MTKRKRKGNRRTITRAQARTQLRGAQQLEPGVWIDREGALHFSVPEILKARGIPATPEAIADATEQLRLAAAAQLPGAEIVIRDLEAEPMTGTTNAAGNGQPTEVQTWWLSFHNGRHFLGVVVVDVTAADVAAGVARLEAQLRHRLEDDAARWIAGAIYRTHEAGCNPGGDVATVRVDNTPAFPVMGWRYPRLRLLSEAELNAIAPVAELRGLERDDAGPVH